MISQTNQSNSSEILNDQQIQLPSLNFSSHFYFNSLFKSQKKKNYQKNNNDLANAFIFNQIPSSNNLNKRSLSSYQRSHQELDFELESKCNYFFIF